MRRLPPPLPILPPLPSPLNMTTVWESRPQRAGKTLRMAHLTKAALARGDVVFLASRRPDGEFECLRVVDVVLPGDENKIAPSRDRT